MENTARIETGRGQQAKSPQGCEADSLSDGDNDTDVGELIDRARGGDRGALNGLMTRIRPRLLAIALRTVRDRDQAEDVAQETLVKVCRYLTRFEGRSSFATWIHRITINTALDFLRRQQSRHDRVADRDAADSERPLPQDSIDDETPERALARAEVGAVVQGAIARLTPSHAQTLALRELEGESYQEIAAKVRCPIGTVMSRLHHARRRLMVELGPALGMEAAQAAA
jgi:RNA polymerase sigma-70 factor (ECF subfamily)